MHDKEGSNDENGPKRRRTRRLGHLVSFSFFSYFIYFDLCFIIYIGGYQQNTRRNRRKRARDASNVSQALIIPLSVSPGFKTRRVLNPRPERRCKPSFGPLSKSSYYYFLVFMYTNTLL